MDLTETKARLETMWWVAHVALLSFSRYREILSDKTMFNGVFPGINFENPKISHTVGESIDFKSTKKELLAKENIDLFIAWQIILAIVGMTSIFDLFLKSKADAVTGSDNSSSGIFDNFDRLTKIDFKKQPFFEELRKYHAVRDISLHNRGIVNQRFANRTNNKNAPAGAYVYYPADISKYKLVLEQAVDYIDSQIM